MHLEPRTRSSTAPPRRQVHRIHENHVRPARICARLTAAAREAASADVSSRIDRSSAAAGCRWDAKPCLTNQYAHIGGSSMRTGCSVSEGRPQTQRRQADGAPASRTCRAAARCRGGARSRALDRLARADQHGAVTLVSAGNASISGGVSDSRSRGSGCDASQILDRVAEMHAQLRLKDPVDQLPRAVRRLQKKRDEIGRRQVVAAVDAEPSMRSVSWLSRLRSFQRHRPHRGIARRRQQGTRSVSQRKPR